MGIREKKEPIKIEILQIPVKSKEKRIEQNFENSHLFNLEGIHKKDIGDPFHYEKKEIEKDISPFDFNRTYVSIESPNVMNRDFLKYIGKSRIDGSGIYEYVGNDPESDFSNLGYSFYELISSHINRENNSKDYLGYVKSYTSFTSLYE